MSDTQYLLDTNIISHLIKSNEAVWQHLRQVAINQVAMSAVTYAEVQFGFAKMPQAVKQKAIFNELLNFIVVLPFDDAVGNSYGIFKAALQQQGKNLAALDLMIAAHAYHVGAVLVTNDQAFFQAVGVIDGFRAEDWTK